MKIRLEEAEFFHVDGWTGRDMMKLLFAFHNSENAPKKKHCSFFIDFRNVSFQKTSDSNL
jgi:hypothetical protein